MNEWLRRVQNVLGGIKLAILGDRKDGQGRFIVRRRHHVLRIYQRLFAVLSSSQNLAEMVITGEKKRNMSEEMEIIWQPL